MKMNQIVLSQEFKDYNRAMAKLNVYGSTLDTLDNSTYTITLTTRMWHLENRKAFSSKPQVSETEKISARQYACYITSIGFFHDRVNNGYTPVGYIPVQLTCYNPDKTVKIQRSFHIVYDTPPWD